MSRVLLVDDHPSVREGVRAVLAREFSTSSIDTASTASEAFERVVQIDPDLIVLDMTVPGRSGPELVSDLKSVSPRSRILVYTVHEEQQLGVRAIRAGADGYLTKDRPIGDLVLAAQAVLAGRRYITPALADALAEAVSTPVELHALLSDREWQVMRMIVAGHLPSQIAEELNLSVKTVSTYRGRILAKLRLSTTAELVRYALMHNLG